MIGVFLSAVSGSVSVVVWERVVLVLVLIVRVYYLCHVQSVHVRSKAWCVVLMFVLVSCLFAS